MNKNVTQRKTQDNSIAPISTFIQELNSNNSSELRLLGEFDENGLAIMQKGDKWGLINKQGVEIYPPMYEWISPFIETYGFYLVSVGKHKYSAIDKDGKILADDILNTKQWPYYDKLLLFIAIPC